MNANYPETPGWKTETPETSKVAALSIKVLSKTLRDRCEEQLTSGEATADEVAERLHKSILSIRPRLSELLAMNRIEDTGARRPNESGKQAVVWRIKKATEFKQAEMF